jgi:hypothetical protein
VDKSNGMGTTEQYEGSAHGHGVIVGGAHPRHVQSTLAAAGVVKDALMKQEALLDGIMAVLDQSPG